MATIYDLPLHTLIDEIFTYIHYIERLKIERTCQLFKNYMPYNDIKQFSLNDPIFKTSIHFLAGSDPFQYAAHAYVQSGMQQHEQFADRLEKLLNLLLLRKRIGPNLYSIHMYKCVISAEAMRLIAASCTNLTGVLRFEEIVITEKDAITLHLPSIRLGELRRLQLYRLEFPLIIFDENQKAEFALAINRFATSANELIELVWSDVQLPFADVPLAHCVQDVSIEDHYRSNQFPVKIDLSNFAVNAVRLQRFNAEIECCVSLPSDLAVLQLTTLRSLSLQEPIKISGSNTDYCLTQTDLNAIGNMKNLETLNLLLHQANFFHGAANQPQLLTLKTIGQLPQLQHLRLILEGRKSLSFTQLKHLLWAVPLKTLELISCFHYFADEYDAEASDTDDILDIIASRVGGTLVELSLDASNAMNNWEALAARQKLTKFSVYKVRNVADEMLRHFSALPSMSYLVLFAATYADGLRFTSSHFEIIASARIRNGYHMRQLHFRPIDFDWPNQQEMDKISQELLKFNVVLVP